MSNPIVTENQNTGTTGWQVKKIATTQIAGWLDQPSYNAGDTVTFYVSTQVGGTTYTINVYRMGWYDGRGGCLKWTSATQTGVAQGYWDSAGLTLNNCPTAVIDSTTHRVESGWSASTTWSIPVGAVTGVYLAQFVDANGFQYYATFIVKGNTTADYCFQYSTFTDAVYNVWGGYSGYTTGIGGTQATKVSLNRPSDQAGGMGNLGNWDIGSIKWLERQGYNLSYISDLDAHTGGASLYQNYKAIIYPGHCEYWSKEMRDAAEAARDSGVGLCFLGANCCYWQVRLEADSNSNANRTIVIYKSTSDPLNGVDNTRVTVRWRDAPVSRPEVSMIGIMYTNITLGHAGFPWTLNASAASNAYVAVSGLATSTNYGSEIVGAECDKQQTGSPSNLVILGSSAFTASDSSQDTSHTAYYIANSGAMVFASGCIQWCFALDTYRQSGSPQAPLVVPELQRLMAAIMARLIQAKGSDDTTVRASSFGFHA